MKKGKDKKIIIKSGKYKLNTLRSSPINPFQSEKEFLYEWRVWNSGRGDEYGSVGELIEISKEEKADILKYYYSLLELFNNFPEEFEIYRYIGLEDESEFEEFYKSLLKGQFLEEYHGLGIYWTLDRNMDTIDLEFGKMHKKDIELLAILTSKVNKKDVDWERTILSNMKIGYSYEKEITLKKGIEITLTKIEKEGYYNLDIYESYELPNIKTIACIRSIKKIKNDK